MLETSVFSSIPGQVQFDSRYEMLLLAVDLDVLQFSFLERTLMVIKSGNYPRLTNYAWVKTTPIKVNQKSSKNHFHMLDTFLIKPSNNGLVS